MSDTPLWLDAFPRSWEAAHERTLRGPRPQVVYYPGARRDGGSDGIWLRIRPAEAAQWTGVFSSDTVPGRLALVASWPEPGTVFVAAGGRPYLVAAADPDRWERLDRLPRRFEPLPARGLALLLDDDGLSAYDGRGLAWEADLAGERVAWAGVEWLGVLDDEVHLRDAERRLRVRVDVRHGRAVAEPLPW